VSPEVKKYRRQVISTAPTAGPIQCRLPPRMLISTTLSGTVIEKVSDTVT